MNKIAKEFNERKLKDLETVHRKLAAGSPRFGADAGATAFEQGEIMNNCSSFIYYYMLLEFNIKNLNIYKDDKETLEEINNSIWKLWTLLYFYRKGKE